jgi:hypothetical protein
MDNLSATIMTSKVFPGSSKCLHWIYSGGSTLSKSFVGWYPAASHGTERKSKTIVINNLAYFEQGGSFSSPGMSPLLNNLPIIPADDHPNSILLYKNPSHHPFSTRKT